VIIMRVQGAQQQRPGESVCAALWKSSTVIAAEQSARQQAATRRPQGGADRRPAALQGWGGEVIAVAGYVGDASGAV